MLNKVDVKEQNLISFNLAKVFDFSEVKKKTSSLE